MTTTDLAPLEDEVRWFLTAGLPERAAIRRDPFPFFRRLRAADPVHRSAQGPWLVTSYEACNAMLRDERWEKARILRDVAATTGAGDGPAEGALAERIFLGSLVFKNPPDHTRLRRIVAPAFSVRAVGDRRERTRGIARRLLDDLRQRPSFDFRRDFASELPVRLICELIGVAPEARQDFLSWADTVRELQELGDRPAEALRLADRKAEDCRAFVADLVAEKRKAPGDDLVSLLIEASDADEAPLSPDELTAMLIILHVGGHSTTTDVIATGCFHLLTNPDAYRRLRQDPDLVGSAVEEMLRFDTAVTVATPRAAAVDVALGDRTIPAGEVVYAVVAAANHDPDQFDQPDRFDVERRDNRHLSFAAGRHFCLGAHLGRQEAVEAFRLLAGEHPELELATDPATVEWQDSLPHRGLQALPVAWRR
ncbi:MAG TPA: cytochrome P450 [Acidimicrobiales bacterium]|nr:cytochrome P450 [Acidimicrobiales bacterium]